MREDTISCDCTSAIIVPERGGLVTKFSVCGREILFLDRVSFEDPEQPVRGGIPILFPFAGRLVDKKLVAAGTTLGLHGFARDLEWTVEDHTTCSHRMILEPGPDILENYPFAHRLTQTTSVGTSELTLTLNIENKSVQPMPVAPGWHPYFCCPGQRKKDVQYSLSDFPYDRLSNETYDFGLSSQTPSNVDFHVPETGALSLAFAQEFRHLQFWTLPNRNFICVEPWDGPADVINSNQARLVSPGETVTYWMQISTERQGD